MVALSYSSKRQSGGNNNNKNPNGTYIGRVIKIGILLFAIVLFADRLSSVVCGYQSPWLNGDKTEETTAAAGSDATDKMTANNDFVSLPAPPTPEAWAHFIDNFQAANPKYTQQCRAYLRSPSEFNADKQSTINWRWNFSQYNQDWFVWVNFFYHQHEKHNGNWTGFYVESGANDPIRVSNTAFLDLCMGWKGLCIEPTPGYHGRIQRLRSCELLRNCLSAVDGEKIHIHGEVPGGETGIEVQCRRLGDVLRERQITNVDFWSLDIEGFEFNALKGVDWDKVNIQSILMEQQDMTQTACEQMNMDYRLTTMGYRKYRIVSDAYYYREPALRFPSTKLLDGYFRELESKRCKNQNAEVRFFTKL